MSRNGWWPRLVLTAAVMVYIVYLVGAYYTFQNLPPLPREVRTAGGDLLFTRSDIVAGKHVLQRYGLQDYGSFLGFGGYFGIDYTAYATELIRRNTASAGLAASPPTRLAELRGDILVVDEGVAKAYEDLKGYLGLLFGDQVVNDRLAVDKLLGPEEIEKLAAYFTWGALIAVMGYTNGFPYTPGLVEPNVHVTKATWVTIFTLLLVIMPVAGYIIIKFIDYWRDERITVQLPPPEPAQRLALLGMALAVLGLSVQGLLGGYMMHLYAEPELYGVDLTHILPFNVARALHYNLAILWIAVSWVSFALFALPYFGLRLSKARAMAILGAGALVSLLALLGIWLSYLGYLPEPLWFLVGSQGRPVVSMGTLWLLLVAALLLYLAAATARTARENSYPFNQLLKILAIGLAGTGVGALVGALPVVRPWSHFTVDEYFRWITIHAFVEGFWPAIVIPILLIMLVAAGMVPPRLAVAVAGLDASLEIATGMIGTAHHYYWGGEPTFWLYLGAVVSTLEVLPIGFLIAYAIVLWRRGVVKTELQKTLLTFILVAALGGAVGVVAFGAGLINMPVVNYYLHGSQATMVHAHLAMPLAYGVPTMLMWVFAYHLAGGLTERDLRLLRKAVVVVAAGFYLQVLLSLGILMYKQFDLAAAQGYWQIKSLLDPAGEPTGFWTQDSVKAAVWARMIGDLVAAAGVAVFLYKILAALPRSLRGA